MRIRAKQCEFGIALFTGNLTFPTLVLGGQGTLQFTVTPKNTGDALAIGDHITWSAMADIPAGFVIISMRVTGLNSIRVQYSAAIAISGVTVAFSVAQIRG